MRRTTDKEIKARQNVRLIVDQIRGLENKLVDKKTEATALRLLLINKGGTAKPEDFEEDILLIIEALKEKRLELAEAQQEADIREMMADIAYETQIFEANREKV